MMQIYCEYNGDNPEELKSVVATAEALLFNHELLAEYKGVSIYGVEHYIPNLSKIISLIEKHHRITVTREQRRVNSPTNNLQTVYYIPNPNVVLQSCTVIPFYR